MVSKVVSWDFWQIKIKELKTIILHLFEYNMEVVIKCLDVKNQYL